MTGQLGKTVALTGATGFLGSHIADSLLAAGYIVRAAVRPTSNLRWLKDKPITILETDLLSAASCREFLGEATALIHCAGMVTARSEQEYFSGNVETTRVLMETAAARWQDNAAAEQTFILISSLAAHGPAGFENPATEDTSCQPITAYGRSKLAAEEIVNTISLPARKVILRPPGLYGPRDREFLPLFKAARLGISASIGRKMEGLSLVDGRDCATAAVTLLQCSQAEGTFFVDDGHCGYRWPEIAAAMGAALDRKVRHLTVPLGLIKFFSTIVGEKRATRSPVLNRDRILDLDTTGWVCDGSRLREATGFSANYPLREGFTETVLDLKEQGLL